MRLIVILLFVSLYGCMPVVKFIGGFRDPKPEDKESLTRYLNKKKINADNILVFADSLSFYKRLREVSDLPQIRVYNKSGMLVYYQDTSASCSGPAYEFTKAICSFSDLKSISSKTFTSETKDLLTLDNAAVTISPIKEWDYYVFIYWARFLGRFNKNHVKVWENNLRNVSGCKVKVYKVDMDWQKRWYEKQQ